MGATRHSYLVEDIVKRVGAVDGEADKDEIRLRVRQRPKPVVLFLAGSIPQGELDRLSRGWVRREGDVVLEDSWDVFLSRRECAHRQLVSAQWSGQWFLPQGSSPGCS